ncbi:MAG: sulfite exporter TauE/SafE family protein [Magnetovibrio sp.]|nr:sulfite exporter TauE/SafE family protein [Magnetovibrio sp.]
MDIPLETLAIVTGTFLIAGTVKGVIGMALPTVSLGLLAATMGLKEAIVLMLVPSFVTNVWQGVVGGFLGELLKRLWTVLAAMCVGIWFATAALALDDTAWLAALLGLTLVAYAVFGLRTPALPRAGRREPWLSPVMGGATGVLAGLTGSTVLPVVPYLQTLGLPRDMLIQAMGICFSTAALGIGVALGGRGLLPQDLGLLSVAGVVPALIGMAFGQRLRRRLSEQRFKQVFFVSTALLGAYIAARALLG